MNFEASNSWTYFNTTSEAWNESIWQRATLSYTWNWFVCFCSRTTIDFWDTVDGRNPASPGMYRTLSIIGYTTYQLGAGFLPSTVCCKCLCGGFATIHLRSISLRAFLRWRSPNRTFSGAPKNGKGTWEYNVRSKKDYHFWGINFWIWCLEVLVPLLLIQYPSWNTVFPWDYCKRLVWP